eukprot:scaffold54794_cov18-Phaeocystis_antarctica.AAC.1
MLQVGRELLSEGQQRREHLKLVSEEASRLVSTCGGGQRPRRSASSFLPLSRRKSLGSTSPPPPARCTWLG